MQNRVYRPLLKLLRVYTGVSEKDLTPVKRNKWIDWNDVVSIEKMPSLLLEEFGITEGFVLHHEIEGDIYCSGNIQDFINEFEIVRKEQYAIASN